MSTKFFKAMAAVDIITFGLITYHIFFHTCGS